MVLSKQNSGKYLTREWHDKRERALKDRTLFTQEELDWLEIGPTEGLGRYRDTTYIQDTESVDGEKTGTRDIRKEPKIGEWPP